MVKSYHSRPGRLPYLAKQLQPTLRVHQEQKQWEEEDHSDALQQRFQPKVQPEGVLDREITAQSKVYEAPIHMPRIKLGTADIILDIVSSDNLIVKIMGLKLESNLQPSGY